MNLKKIKIQPSFLLVLFINLLMNNFRLYVLSFLIFVFHELGHIVLIYLKRGRINKITLFAFGASIDSNLEDDLLVDFGRHIC